MGTLAVVFSFSCSGGQGSCSGIQVIVDLHPAGA